MATKLPYVLPFEDGSVVAAILLKAQGLPDKEQIATKTELQQATAYLATLDNATMAPQSATVKRETDALQAQIDNIVRAPESGGDVGAEVYQARVGADGTTYQTLKERLDVEESNLSEELSDLGNWVGYAPRVLTASSFHTADTANWELTVDGYDLTIVHKNTLSTGTPTANIVVEPGTYKFTADFTNSSIKYFGLYVDHEYQTLVRDSDTITVESGHTYQLLFGSSSTGTYLIRNIALQSSEISGKIQELEALTGELDYVVPAVEASIERQPGYNLLDVTKVSDGYLGSSGELIPNRGTDWVATDFIRATQTHIVATRKDGVNSRGVLEIHFIVEYDKDKEVLHYTQIGSNEGLFTLASDTVYFRVCYHSTNTVEPMLAFGGSIVHPYEQYQTSYRVNHDALPEQLIQDNAVLSENIVPIPGTEIELTITPKKLIVGSNGAITNYDNNDYTIAEYVLDGTVDSFLVTASANFNNLFWAIYNSGGSVIARSARAAGSGTPTKIEKELVSIPQGSAKLVIANVISPSTPEQHLYPSSLGIQAEAITQAVLDLILQQAAPAKPWTGKKWVCVGDSLTEVNSRTTKHYFDYVAELTGITTVNMGVSGSGYKRKEDTNQAFYQRVANIPTDADVVTIFGSGNDLTYISDLGTPTDATTDTLCGCINATLDVIIQRIPAVSLGIVSPTPWTGNQPTLDDSNPMARYSKALAEICKIRSIPLLDLYHCSNLRPWTAEGRAACYTKDDGGGVHPDETGHKLIAPRFKVFVESLLM